MFVKGRRYYNYPFYNYHVLGLKEEQGATAIIVYRAIESEQGNKYVDFYEFGMNDEILKEAGFACRDSVIDCTIFTSLFTMIFHAIFV